MVIYLSPIKYELFLRRISETSPARFYDVLSAASGDS